LKSQPKTESKDDALSAHRRGSCAFTGCTAPGAKRCRLIRACFARPGGCA
jgi:hypothetical protein